MITVKVELWPHGDEERATEIGRMYIANDGSGSVDRGDYIAAVCRRGTDEVPLEIYGDRAGPDFDDSPKAARAAEIKNYPRLAYNQWRLIARALLATFPEEAKRSKRDERTLLDEQVMSGLAELARLAELAGIPSGTMYDDRTQADVKAALAWLKADQRDA
jgi:hypothetical protein